MHVDRVAVSEVLVKGELDQNQVVIHGRLADGAQHYVELPALGVSSEAGDRLVGNVTQDGWLIKTKLVDGDAYWLSRSEPGKRAVDYEKRDASKIVIKT